MVTEGQCASGHRDGRAPRSRGECGWANADLARIGLLWVLIALYMLFGAAIFSALERPEELRARRRWEQQVTQFAREHQVSASDLRTLLKQYEEANAAGVRADPRRPRWDFSGSFYFVATVVTTIGFGMTAPSTICGKIFLIPYGLLGCAATILFFNLFLERAITLISFAMYRCHRRGRSRSRARDRAPGGGGGREGGVAVVEMEGEVKGVKDEEEDEEEEKKKKDWRPSVYHVTLVLSALALLVAFAASGLYSAVEGWGYFEALYFCFVTFSTMGFGDLVSGQRDWYAGTWVYQVSNSLVILLGVCCTYSLFNITSVIVKQGLNWTLTQLLCLWRGCCGGWCGWGGGGGSRAEQGPPGVIFCCCCCCYPGGGSHVGVGGGQTSLRTQLRLTATKHGRRWSFSVVRFASSSAPPRGKCWCSGAEVETVCSRAEVERGAKRVGDGVEEGHRCRKLGDAVSGARPQNLHTPVSGRRGSRTFARRNSLPEGVGAIAMLSNRLQETRINP
ncbi:hypothetical protein ACEWY4_008505 [Coilia grayii]|uniref:Potassium channel domain-containing protein n=1 Tax=Coilia grayii TaxID=363190 RepID=A0ABD1KB37_9TELE